MHKRRFDKHTAHKSAVHGRGANVLGSRKAREDRNEIERHVVEHIEQDIKIARIRNEIEHRWPEYDGNGFEHARREQQWNHRNHGAREVVKNRIANGCRGKRCFDSTCVEVLVDALLLGQAAHLDELVIYLRHVLPNNHLELPARYLSADDAVNFFNSVNVGQLHILKVKTQTRHAVGCKGDVVFATQRLEHIGCDLLIVSHIIFPFERSGSSLAARARRQSGRWPVALTEVFDC